MATYGQLLAERPIRERYLTAVGLVREHPDSGELLLSYVLWPDEVPDLATLDYVVEFKRRAIRRKAERMADDLTAQARRVAA